MFFIKVALELCVMRLAIRYRVKLPLQPLRSIAAVSWNSFAMCKDTVGLGNGSYIWGRFCIARQLISLVNSLVFDHFVFVLASNSPKSRAKEQWSLTGISILQIQILACKVEYSLFDIEWKIAD